MFSYFSRCLTGSCLIILLIVSSEVEGQADHEARVKDAKLDLWSRGAFALDELLLFGTNPEVQAEQLERHVALAPLTLGPVKETRRTRSFECLRGGASEYSPQLEDKIVELGKELGPEFSDAIEQVSP